MKFAHLAVFLLAVKVLAAQNQQPILSNVQVQLNSNHSFTINYDLTDAESDAMTVSLSAGPAGSSALSYVTANAVGDLGDGILPGNGKQITWDFSANAADTMNEFRIMLVADDHQPIDIQSLVDLVDSVRMFGDLSFIEGIRHRQTGTAHLQEVKDFIGFQFLDKGLETYSQNVPFGNYTGQNLVGKRPGTGMTGETYILGGHFDSVDDAPGADDNGSAVAGMLEAMRILSQYPSKKTIKFIGFDLEEEGLIGSQKYVASGITNGETVAGMIDFEMIGYYTEEPNTQTFPVGFNVFFPAAYNDVASQEFKGNFITNVGKVGNSSTLMEQYKTSSNTYVPDLRVINVQAPNPFPPDLGRSDHAPFWVANYPAIMLTDGANFRNPYYHTPGDSLGTINFSFMTNVVKGAVATLAELVELQHADNYWVDTDFYSPTNEAFDCGLTILPNPAHDQVFVRWEGCAKPVQRLGLYDSFGRKLMSKTPTGVSETLNIEQLSSGVYLLKIENSMGSKIERIVVEK